MWRQLNLCGKKTHLQTWHFIHHQHSQALARNRWKLIETEGKTYINVWSQTNGVSAEMFSVLLLILTQLLINPLAENDNPAFQAHWTSLTRVSKATEVMQALMQSCDQYHNPSDRFYVSLGGRSHRAIFYRRPLQSAKQYYLNYQWVGLAVSASHYWSPSTSKRAWKLKQDSS